MWIFYPPLYIATEHANIATNNEFKSGIFGCILYTCVMICGANNSVIILGR